jgi:nucleoside-diphosphate-sugar epimerase
LEEPIGPDVTPNSPYAAAKWGCQVYGKMFRKLYGMEVVQTRIFMTYGPGQDSRKVIPYMILSLLSGQSPILASNERLVDWIYIDDVVEGLLAASRWARPDGQPVDIGSGVGTSVGSVADKLCRLIDPEIPLRFDVLQKRKDEVVRVADVETSHRKIGWRPQISLEDGLQKTIAWTKERCRTDPTYREPGSTKGFSFGKARIEKKGAAS